MPGGELEPYSNKRSLEMVLFQPGQEKMHRDGEHEGLWYASPFLSYNILTILQLDGGRHYYPPEFVVELCAYLSFFKQNTFHLHLSDNLYNNVDIYSLERQLSLYAAFRPWSDDPAVAGLNRRANESYTRSDFDSIQSQCAARGVTIIPEIESPGHALVISQWKPELGLNDSLDLLNVSYPDTIPTVETIWNTFMPWFHSKVVHIGADEYVDSSLTEE